MLRPSSKCLIFGCFLALLLACYGPALFCDRQFAYRDAGHYYYPLYERVQKEWNEGRWPLWEPEENGGMPLLGNPTAAVLYPGKVIYALFPYPWAARLYVVAHTALAFAGVLALMRSWGASPTASAVSALSYAFGAPILFQYCNVIYLVGSAWLPFGLRAADRWLRLGRRAALLELALVLAMETLGGDPEVAYLTGLYAGGYAIALAWLGGRGGERRVRLWPIVLGGVVLAVAWVAGTLALAGRLPRMRPEPGKFPPRAFSWMAWVPAAVMAAWAVPALVLVARWRRRHWRSALAAMLIGLACSAALAAALSGAQLLPVLEFTRQSGRAAGEGPHDIYPFSLEPARVAEFLWPNVTGTAFTHNRAWLPLAPPVSGHGKVWVPSLYVGGLTLILALGAAGFRGGPVWRGWLTAIAFTSLLGSLGEFSSPIWWARWSPSVAQAIGPHDPVNVASIRHDRYLRDGDGGFYWTLATVVPGFKQFRFPSKLLTFTALALAALAGLGWDRVLAGQWRRTAALACCGFVLSVAVLVVVMTHRGHIEATFARWGSNSGTAFGPLDVRGAFQDVRNAIAQGAAASAAGMLLVVRRWRSSGWAGAALLVAVMADLGVANARYVRTVPQSVFTATPKVVRLIEQAEREEPSHGPYRVHRVPLWNPTSWQVQPSGDRVLDFVSWERDTIQPKYGLPYGVQYTKTIGVAELYDYEWFFGPFQLSLRPEAAEALAAKPGQKIVVYPRRGFDIWNTRYFILPAYPADWNDEYRGYASFLPNTEAVYPEKGAFDGPGGKARREEWVKNEDLQIRRNRAALPRAWVVHSARSLKPIHGLGRDERDAQVQEILYSDDPFWSERHKVAYDPRVLAWVDSDQRGALLDYLPGPHPGLTECVTVTSYGPQRVEIDAELERPGLVVLADVFYPGWRLTIDGVPAPIYRANRLMRAAAVRSGRHHLVYSYEPESFRIGCALSAVGFAALLALSAWFGRRPVSPLLAPTEAGANGALRSDSAQAETPVLV
jgi:hypothetical protein